MAKYLTAMRPALARQLRHVAPDESPTGRGDSGKELIRAGKVSQRTRTP